MMTNNNEELMQSSTPRSGMESNKNEVGSDNDSEATLTDYNSDSESNTSSNESSDNDASDEEVDELELQQLQDKISCPDCGRFFSL